MISVLFDQQEQRPWAFSPTEFTMKRADLPTGDYVLEGLEDRLCIERKSLGDYVGTVIQDWIRFRKELYRLAGFDFACIVVEANLQDVIEHRYESRADPMSVIGKTHAIYLDHGIPVFFWGKRDECIPMVERLLIQAHKKLR